MFARLLFLALCFCFCAGQGKTYPGYTKCSCSPVLGKSTPYGPRCPIWSSSYPMGSFLVPMKTWFPADDFGPAGWSMKYINGTQLVVSKDCLWRCTPVQIACPSLPASSYLNAPMCPNGKNVGPFPSGTKCTQTCISNYEPYRNNNTYSVCKSGRWIFPSCRPKQCTSPPPKLSVGSYYQGCKRRGSTGYNSYCRLICPTNYVASGYLRCNFGTWVPASCVHKSKTNCNATGLGSAPTNGQWGCTTVATGKTCSAVCSTGFAPDYGTNGSPARCNNGQWITRGTPQCLPISCKGPAPRGQGLIVYQKCADKPNGYTCPIGCPYPMSMKNPSKCVNGQWQQGSCSRKCFKPVDPINGRYAANCSGLWAGSFCNLTCNPGYKPTGNAECQKDGKWSPEYCDKPGLKSCSASTLKQIPPSKGPTFFRNGKGNISQKGRWQCTSANSGQSCQLICTNPYFPQGQMPTCLDGQWSYPCGTVPYCYWSGAVVGRPYLLEDGDQEGLSSQCVSTGMNENWWRRKDEELEVEPLDEAHGEIQTQMVDSLPPEDREVLAGFWSKQGLGEHASVAAFSRVSLQLIASQAPPELLQGSHQAALDEIKHAKLCFDLAADYGEAPMEPGEFPAHQLSISSDRRALALGTFSEGCLGETISVIDAATRLQYTEAPKVRIVLDAIVEDESRHAGLAWATVAWGMTEDMEDEITRRIAEFDPTIQVPKAQAEIGSLLEAHGVTTENSVQSGRQAVDCLIVPLADELLLHKEIDVASLEASGCKEVDPVITQSYIDIAASAGSVQLVQFYRGHNM